MTYHCTCGEKFALRARWNDHYYSIRPTNERLKHKIVEPTRMKRTAEVVGILEKMGYSVDITKEVDFDTPVRSTPTTTKTTSATKADEIIERIKRMPTWDEKLLEHTFLRVNSMSESQLRARVYKIKDRDKMLYFAKVLIDKNWYPSVLREIVSVIKQKGW